jgi:hypothetical protein
MNGIPTDGTPSHPGGAAVVERVAALIGRLRIAAPARPPSGSGDAEPHEDLWDPVGVPDPITISLGRSTVRLARWRGR